jgi:hypothetical protein
MSTEANLVKINFNDLLLRKRPEIERVLRSTIARYGRLVCMGLLCPYKFF